MIHNFDDLKEEPCRDHEGSNLTPEGEWICAKCNVVIPDPEPFESAFKAIAHVSCGPMCDNCYEEWYQVEIEKQKKIEALKDVEILDETVGALAFSGTTKIHIRFQDGQYEARVGFAVMGHTNMDEWEYQACGCNPFHPDFNDNYASGVAPTRRKALYLLVCEMKDNSESFFSF